MVARYSRPHKVQLDITANMTNTYMSEPEQKETENMEHVAETKPETVVAEPTAEMPGDEAKTETEAAA